MLDDPVALRALCRSFVTGLSQLENDLRVRSVLELEAELGRHVVALANGLGWRTGPTFRLRPIDYPKVGPFPKLLHQHTGRIRLDGTPNPELWLNSNAIGSGSFGLMVERLPPFLWLFGALLERGPEIVADVPFFPGDACFWNAAASSANQPNACLVPDPDYFKTAGYAEFRAAMEAGAVRWEARRGAVHWRGSTSGIKRYWPPRAPDDVQWLARLELCARARSAALAEHCDIGFMNLVQVPPPERPAIEAALAPLRRPPVPKEEAARFKAVVDIDGNSNTWSSGLYCSFLSGACVIKVDSEHGFRQWYYDRLVPWVHYVPVRADFADFEAHVRLVMGDDDLARRIAEAGRELAFSMSFAGELSATVDRLTAWVAGAGSTAAASLFAQR